MPLNSLLLSYEMAHCLRTQAGSYINPSSFMPSLKQNKIVPLCLSLISIFFFSLPPIYPGGIISAGTFTHSTLPWLMWDASYCDWVRMSINNTLVPRSWSSSYSVVATMPPAATTGSELLSFSAEIKLVQKYLSLTEWQIYTCSKQTAKHIYL